MIETFDWYRAMRQAQALHVVTGNRYKVFSFYDPGRRQYGYAVAWTQRPARKGKRQGCTRS